MEYCPYGNLQTYIESKREKFIDQINPSTGKFDVCYPPDIDNLLQKIDRYPYLPIFHLIFHHITVMLTRFATPTLSSRVTTSQPMEISNHWLQKTWSRTTIIIKSRQGVDVTPDQQSGLQTRIIWAQFHPQKWQKRLTIIRVLMVIKTLLVLLKVRIVKTSFRYSQGK